MKYKAILEDAPDNERDTICNATTFGAAYEWAVAMIKRHPKASVEIFELVYKVLEIVKN